MDNSICLIIPTYNRDTYLERAIKSAYNIPFDEIIVIDDGSCPEIIQLVEGMLKNYPKVKYIKNPINAGVSAAKNLGIAACNSNWICILDDDDYFSRNVIPDIKALMRLHPENDIIHFRINTASSNGFGVWGATFFTLKEIKQDNLIPNGSFFKKEVWEKLGGFRLIPFEDWDLWIRAKQAKFNFRFFSQIFYVREIRIDESSLLFRDQQKTNYDEWKAKYILEEKIKIVQLADIPCANSGYELSKLLNTYAKDYESNYILGQDYPQTNMNVPFRKFPAELLWQTQKEKCIEIIKNADIIHVHHDFNLSLIEPYIKNKPIIYTLYAIACGYKPQKINYYSKVKKYATLITVADQSLQRIVFEDISKHYLPLVNCLFNENTEKDNTIPKTVFAPTNRLKIGASKKMYYEVLEIIKHLTLRGIRFDFILNEGLSYEEDLNRKRKADIIIDDVDPEFEKWHNTSLQSACFGAIPLTNYSDINYPFLKTNIHTLEETLIKLFTHKDYLQAEQKRMVAWRQTQYIPDKLLLPYEELYRKCIS